MQRRAQIPALVTAECASVERRRSIAGLKVAAQHSGARDAVLEFAVEVDAIAVNGIDLLTWDAAGRIVEFKVMLRPPNSIDAIRQEIGQMLKSRQQPG